MSEIEKIEAEILKLSTQEFNQLKDWLLELDEKRWDEQIEKDVAAGKLDFLGKEALAEHKAGRTRPLEEVVGMISDDEATEMIKAINAGCRQVDSI